MVVYNSAVYRKICRYYYVNTLGTQKQFNMWFKLQKKNIASTYDWIAMKMC